MTSLEIKVSAASLKLSISVLCMSVFNLVIVFLTLIAALRFRIIIKRKIIRHYDFLEGEDDLNQSSPKEALDQEDQENPANDYQNSQASNEEKVIEMQHLGKMGNFEDYASHNYQEIGPSKGVSTDKI